MTIRKDSGNLLLYIYKLKIENKEMLDSNQLIKETEWNKVRINNASQYLIDSGFVKGKIFKGMDSTKVIDTIIIDITPSGINIIEAQSEFKQNFGFTVNLGLIQINWGAQES